MISAFIVFIVGLLLDAVMSVFFQLDFLFIQPGFVSFFAFSFWVLLNVRLSFKNRLYFTLFAAMMFEIVNYNTYWMYFFVLLILWPVFAYFSSVLRQSYLDQYILVNIMALLWLFGQYGYMKLFSLSSMSFLTFFSRIGFLTIFVQLFVSLIAVFVVHRLDRYLLRKDMEKRRAEYVSYRGVHR